MDNIVQILGIIASQLIINNQLKMREDIIHGIITTDSDFTKIMHGYISDDIVAINNIVNGGSDDV